MKNNESEVLEFAFNGVILFTKALIKDVEKKNMCGDKVEVVKSLVEELQEVISEKMNNEKNKEAINGK